MTEKQRQQCIENFQFLKDVCSRANELTGPNKEAVAAELLKNRKRKR